MHSAECSRDSRRILVGLLVGRFGARILLEIEGYVVLFSIISILRRGLFQTFRSNVTNVSKSILLYPVSSSCQALCLKSVSTRVSVVAPKSEHVRMIHAWTGHKLSKRFKLAARGKRRKRKKKATKCLSL